MSKLLGRKLKQRRHTPHRTIKSEAGIPATAPGEELPEEEIAGFMDDDHRHAIIARIRKSANVAPLWSVRAFRRDLEAAGRMAWTDRPRFLS